MRLFIKNMSVILLFTVLAVAVGTAVGFNPLASALVGVVLAFVPKGMPAGAFGTGGLEVEVWHNWIVEQLWPANPFVDRCRKADEFVINGKFVHIPQSGAAAGGEKNRESLPAGIVKRVDTQVLYGLDEFTTNPRLLEDIETIQLSYNKMESMMGQDRKWLGNAMAMNLLYKWAESCTNVVETSGSNVASHLSGTSGTNRKAFTLDDLEALKVTFDDQDLPEEGRILLLDHRLYDQLVGKLKLSDYRDFSQAFDRATGKIVGKLFSFEIMSRSGVLRANASNTVLDPFAFTATNTDNAVGLAWHPDWVERALGEVKVFESRQDPEYYGDIYSMLGRSGGRRVSKDDVGVALIRQAAV